MNKLKLLVITRDFTRYVHSEPFYLLEELSNVTDVTVSSESGDIQDILKKLGVVPAFIFIYLYASEISPSITGLRSLKIPYAIYLEDLHYKTENLRNKISQENITNIFTCYRDAFHHFLPEFSPNAKWLPHHVNTKIFKDYHQTKDIDFLIMGSVSPVYYPLRTKIIETMSSRQGFVYHNHPGYRNFNDEERTAFVKDTYAKEINRAKLFFTCDSIFKYPLLKYFEVLACKTLLLAPSLKELIDLGFLPGIHFVEIDENNFEERAMYYLEHEEERNKIAENGFKMVHEKHSTQKRVKVLLNMIKEILDDYSK